MPVALQATGARELSNAIASIKHKGLRQLFQDGNRKGVSAEYTDKLERMLPALHYAQTIDEIGRMQGWRLHPLKGDMKGFWSLTVTRNYRLIFRFTRGDAHDLDLVDYH